MRVKLLCLLTLISPTLLMAQAPGAGATARKAVDLFLSGKYAELNQMFSTSGKDAYSEAALTKLGGSAKAYGDVRKIGDPSVRDMGLVSVVTIPVEFSKQNIDFTIPVNSTGQLGQFYLRPGQVPWSQPDYVKAAAFQTREVTVGTDEWKLPATLTYPAGKSGSPAVVLVPDSGPSDRDATVFVTKVFRDVAEGLSSRGIAVLRYEKRSRQYAVKVAGTSYTIDDDTVHDAMAAVALLRTQPEVDPKRIYVAGFGVGGYITPRIAEDDGKLAGMLLLGAPAHSLEDLVLETAISIGVTGPKLDQIKQQVAKVKKLEPGDSDAPPQLGQPVSYWLNLKGYDAPDTAKKQMIPILVLQGSRDFQVKTGEFDAWKTALGGRKDVTLKSYPALNHLMVAGQGESNEAEYRKPGHVAVDVVDDMAKFINP